MALNQKTNTYEEYPRSQFPSQVDNWSNKQDIPVTMQPVLAQYQEAWDNMDIEVINSLQEKYPDITTYLFTADDINQVFDGVKAVQQFFKDDVEDYLTTIRQYTVGINDSPTDGEKTATAYSAAKVESLIGTTLATNITVSTSDWTEVTRNDGFNYKWTYSNNEILSTDEIVVYFNNASMIPASKAMVVVDEDDSDGLFSLISVKIPKKELIIREVKVIRE